MHITHSGAAALLLALLAGGCDDPAGTIGGETGPPPLALPVIPIGGVMNQDWFLTNYVDEVTGPGIGDYTCGPKSYDGHLGVDLVLPSFAAMDAGVAVVAAGPGVVTHTHDGEYDRHTTWSNAAWNVVWVDHGNGYEAGYGHLRTNSVRVAVGQQVQAGDTLGFVGSSGRSDMPHLHFELRHDGSVVDPFAGPCGAEVDQWSSPLPYQDAFRLIDAGVTTAHLDSNLDVVKAPAPAAETVTAGETLYNWMHLHNGSGTLRWVLRGPGGRVLSFDGSIPFYSMSWWWYHTPTADFAPGTWTTEFLLNGEILTTRTFTVVEGPAAQSDAAGIPIGGMGGGGIR